jgi:ADP-ribose pyrophosphatase YjhB (NUDIX family)
VETGETAAHALEREIEEECAIALTGAPELRSVHFNRQASPRDHVLFYVVRDFTILGERKPDREIAQAGLFPIRDLPRETTPATRRRIAEVFDGVPATDFW